MCLDFFLLELLARLLLRCQYNAVRRLKRSHVISAIIYKPHAKLNGFYRLLSDIFVVDVNSGIERSIERVYIQIRPQPLH